MGTSSAVVRVDGLRKLRRDLRQLPAGMADLKEANQRTGQLVVQAARPPRGKTGRLAQAGRASRAAGRVSVLWGGAAVPYAGPIHWGWPSHHIEAQPFVVEAAQRTEPIWLEAYLADVDRALQPLYGSTY